MTHPHKREAVTQIKELKKALNLYRLPEDPDEQVQYLLVVQSKIDLLYEMLDANMDRWILEREAYNRKLTEMNNRIEALECVNGG